MLSKTASLQIFGSQYIAGYNIRKFDIKPEHGYTSFRGIPNARVKHMNEERSMGLEMQARGLCVPFVCLFL